MQCFHCALHFHCWSHSIAEGLSVVNLVCIHQGRLWKVQSADRKLNISLLLASWRQTKAIHGIIFTSTKVSFFFCKKSFLIELSAVLYTRPWGPEMFLKLVSDVTYYSIRRSLQSGLKLNVENIHAELVLWALNCKIYI